MRRAPGDAQVSVQSEEREGRGGLAPRGGLREDKGRSRSKNSIISADARTSLGFPGADNGALFEESFCARPRCPVCSLSLPSFLLYIRIRFPSSSHLFAHARYLYRLFFSLAISRSFYRMKIQSSSWAKRHNYTDRQ